MPVAEAAAPTLYTTAILRLSVESAALARLPAPDGTASARAPLCGSTMTADVMLSVAGQVVQFGGAIQACALGQASAALLSAQIAGAAADDLHAAHALIGRYLADESDDLTGWQAYDVFAPARAKPARHGAILLPFEAAMAAIKAAS
jgi:NifU-like protein involved in Fe-S cluster formation